MQILLHKNQAGSVRNRIVGKREKENYCLSFHMIPVDCCHLTWKMSALPLVDKHGPQIGFLHQDLAEDLYNVHAANSGCKIKY